MPYLPPSLEIGDGSGSGTGSGVITLSKVTPKSQSITWDRTGTPPNITSLLVNINEGTQIDFIDIMINYDNTSTEWLSDNPNGTPMLTTISTNGISSSIQLFLANVGQLPAGNYSATIWLVLYNSAGTYNNSLQTGINLSLTGNPTNAIQPDKQTYNVTYNRETNTLSGETDISVLNNTNQEPISFETVGTLFKELTVTDSFTLQDDPAAPFATNPELPQNGVLNITARLKKNGVFQSGFIISITVIEAEKIITDKTTLDFELRKGMNEGKTAVVKIINPYNKDFTITTPSWLDVTPSSGNTSLNITVETDNSESIAKGNYSDEIVIHYDTNKTTVVNVNLTVLEFLKAEFLPLNFCLDPQHEIEITKMNDEGLIAKITLEMTFETQEGLNVFTAECQIPYFLNMASTHIGKKIQSYFSLFAKNLEQNLVVPFNNQMVYKPAVIKLKIEELSSDYTVLFTAVRENIKFFAGKKPAQFPLFTNHPVRRHYSGTPFIFSYYNATIGKMNFLNQDVVNNIEVPLSVQTAIVSDQYVDLQKLKNNFVLDILPFPSGTVYTNVQWLNENLVPEGIVFAGTYKNEVSLQHTYDDYEQDSEKYDTEEKNKITINTGFITHEEIKLVKELIKSKLCFVTVENMVFKCFCITDKLNDIDYEATLNQFNLDFFIVK